MMYGGRRSVTVMMVLTLAVVLASTGVAAAQGKPNILFIMGDDIGIWNIGAYHRGMMAGRTPNLDRIAAEGMLFTDYYAEASCTAGRANFITGEVPVCSKRWLRGGPAPPPYPAMPRSPPVGRPAANPERPPGFRRKP